MTSPRLHTLVPTPFWGRYPRPIPAGRPSAADATWQEADSGPPELFALANPADSTAISRSSYL